LKPAESIAKARETVQTELRWLDARWRPTLVVACAAVALLLPKYTATLKWFPRVLTMIGGAEFARICADVHFDQTFLLQGVFPFLMVIAMREGPRDYGLGLGDVRLGLKMCGFFYLLYIPCFIVLFMNSGFQQYYAGVACSYSTWGAFFGAQIPTLLFLCFRTEFLFRGFILFGIKKDYGPYVGILMQIIPYVMVHAGKAQLEALGSLPVGLALAYLAVRTGSIWYGALLHGSIALLFNALILFLHFLA